MSISIHWPDLRHDCEVLLDRLDRTRRRRERGMSDLARFREHCAAMATAEHTSECARRMAKWEADTDASRYWDIDPGPRPECTGCVTGDDRALFARLAAEVDDYLDPHPTLWEDAT